MVPKEERAKSIPLVHLDFVFWDTCSTYSLTLKVH